MKKNSRNPTIDLLRGFAVLSMILYHGVWSAVHQKGLVISWYTGIFGFIWQQSIAWSFILLAGYSFSLGRNPLKKGALLILLSWCITGASLIATPTFPIYFGILHLLGWATWITTILKSLLRQIAPPVGLILFAALFALTYQIPEGIGGLPPLNISLPAFLFRNHFTAAIGFPPKGFISADYYPLIPWICLYLVGYFFEKALPLRQLPQEKSSRITSPIQWAGHHTLLLYLIHQPLIQLILFFVDELSNQMQHLW